jgi:hypothetical protein
MSPTDVVVEVFEGIRGAARAVGVEPSTVLRWNERNAGLIPHRYMRPFLEAAAKRRKRLSLEEIVWGRPNVHRQVITFLTPTPVGALGRMAEALTA